MVEESVKQSVDRFYALLYAELLQKIPQPSNPFHIYSRGALHRGFKVVPKANGYDIIISNGINYGGLALGFYDNGTRRTASSMGRPLGVREKHNFKIVDRAIMRTSKIVGTNFGCEVFLNGQIIK